MNSCTPGTNLYLGKLSVTFKYKLFLGINAFKMKRSLILAFMQWRKLCVANYNGSCMFLLFKSSCINRFKVLANVAVNQENFNVVYSPLKGSFNDKFVALNQCHSKFRISKAEK